MNVHRHRAGVDELCHPPDAVQQLVAGEDLSGMPRQKVEQVEFLGGEQNFLTGEAYQTRLWVERQVAKAQRTARRRLACCPSGVTRRLHTAHGSLRAEGLDYVIVSAQFQPGDAVGLLVPRGEQDDWRVRAVASLAGEAEAVQPRQHHIQDHKVGNRRASACQQRPARRCRRWRCSQRAANTGRPPHDSRLVFDNHDVGHGYRFSIVLCSSVKQKVITQILRDVYYCISTAPACCVISRRHTVPGVAIRKANGRIQAELCRAICQVALQ